MHKMSLKCVNVLVIFYLFFVWCLLFFCFGFWCFIVMFDFKQWVHLQ